MNKPVNNIINLFFTSGSLMIILFVLLVACFLLFVLLMTCGSVNKSRTDSDSDWFIKLIQISKSYIWAFLNAYKSILIHDSDHRIFWIRTSSSIHVILHLYQLFQVFLCSTFFCSYVFIFFIWFFSEIWHGCKIEGAFHRKHQCKLDSYYHAADWGGEGGQSINLIKCFRKWRG